jgi:ATP-dependent Lon protease
MDDLNLPEPTPDQIPERLPVIPLRDVVIFPYMIFPVLIGRDSSIQAVTEAIEHDKFIFVTTQKDPEEEEPTARRTLRLRYRRAHSPGSQTSERT